MIWFFERGAETAKLEVIRRVTHFEISVRRPDGTESIETVHGASNLLVEMERVPGRLSQEGWRPIPGDPLLLSGGRRDADR